MPKAPPLKILVASSEVAPFAKTGGLADVAGSLPKALAYLGHEVCIVMPKYKIVDVEKWSLLPLLPEMVVNFDKNTYRGQILRCSYPGTRIPVYFVQQDEFFNRETLYTEFGKDYPDNAERFAFFCMAALWMLKGLDWSPDIIVCNDWQTSLIPVYLKSNPLLDDDPFYNRIKVLLTVHNLAYQGLFAAEVIPRIGLSWDMFKPQGMEFFGKVNLLKGGLLFADALNTVSRQYAREIQTAECGCGLEGVLQMRSKDLVGILNGIDASVWNPNVDKKIAENYSAKHPGRKQFCKAELQRRCNLPQNDDVPVLGIISRLTDQKGFDLIAEVIDEIMKLDLQLVVLGTGELRYHEMLEEIGRVYPNKARVVLAFDDDFAHQIEAGANMFLMPSRYEPCGLNQLYSLRYGAVPIVRKTGGLADSVVNATEASIKDGKGTGFVFTEYSGKALLNAVRTAVKFYHTDKAAWKKLMANGMAKDFSWTASAKEYVKLFKKMIQAE